MPPHPPTFLPVLGLRTGGSAIERKHWINLAMGTGATVFGGLILRYFDLLDDALAWLLNTATYSIAVPAGLLALLVAALGWLLWPHVVRLVQPGPTHPDTKSTGRSTKSLWKDDLEELDQKILVCLGARHGKTTRIKHLVKLVNSDKLRVDSSLDRLIQLGLVNVSYNYLYGSSYHLTGVGRDLLIEQNLVPPASP